MLLAKDFTPALLLILSFVVVTKSQLSVTWNGTTVSGPVLIYQDEIGSVDAVADDDPRNGLSCRSASSEMAGWHLPFGPFISSNDTSSPFVTIRTDSGVIPSASRLVRGVRLETDSASGLYTCRWNGVAEGSIPVGIYLREGGNGRITTNLVSLTSSFSFLTDPSTFTLVGETSGGPPTTYTWTRDGVNITDGDPFSISLSLNESSPRGFVDSLYVSTLTVTGRYPGVYGYSVTNRATHATVSQDITIEGGGAVTNLSASVISHPVVLITWTAPSPAPSGGYQVTVASASISEAVSRTLHVIKISQPGVHTIQVQPLSRHYPGEVVSVEVTVRSPEGCQEGVSTSIAVLVSAVVTFLFAIILYTIILLVGCAVWRCSMTKGTNERGQDVAEIYEEVDALKGSTGVPETSVHMYRRSTGTLETKVPRGSTDALETSVHRRSTGTLEPKVPREGTDTLETGVHSGSTDMLETRFLRESTDTLKMRVSRGNKGTLEMKVHTLETRVPTDTLEMTPNVAYGPVPAASQSPQTPSQQERIYDQISL